MAGSTPFVIPKLAKTPLKISLDPMKYNEQLHKVKKHLAKAHKCAPEEVTLVTGSTQACFQTLAAITEPGDSIIIEHPGYEPYLAAAKFLGLNVLRYHRTGDFNRDFKELVSLARTANVLLLSNPHCPTGWMYSPRDLEHLARLNLLVVIDEVFLPLLTKGTLSYRPEIAPNPNFIFLSGLSKSTGLGMTRIGWIVAEPSLTAKVHKVGLHLNLNMPQPLLQVADHAFKNWKTIIKELQLCANVNRKLVLKFIAAHPDVFSYDFKYGFFAMMKVPPQFETGAVFTAELLKHDIFVRDGAFFEMPEWVRIHALLPPKQFAKVFTAIAGYYK